MKYCTSWANPTSLPPIDSSTKSGARSCPGLPGADVRPFPVKEGQALEDALAAVLRALPYRVGGERSIKLPNDAVLADTERG